MNRFTRWLDTLCIRNRSKGIPNLMLYISIGSAFIYLMTAMDPSYALYRLLCFDRSAILRGQLWRLVTFVIAEPGGLGALNMLLTLISLYFYWQCGNLIERQIGTFKFNLYYLSGVLLMDIAGLITGLSLDASSLNLTLLLAFALLYGEARILLMMIIPIKAKVIGWVYIALLLYQFVFTLSPIPLVPLIPLVLFFWRELPGLLPDSWRWKLESKKRNRERTKAKPNPNWAAGYQSKSGRPAYHHKCTVCGRTDTDNPGLEFRYCSRCSGYRCYCMEHINDHAHIVDTE